MGRRITNLELDEKLADIKDDVRFIKSKLFDPDTGVTARVNRNTSFRRSTGKVLWSSQALMKGGTTKLIFWN